MIDDRTYSYLGIRGLQRPGDYNNKVLLAIDGHTVNGNVYGDAYFGQELGLDMEAVERIEVVRGPGSTLYGGSAVLAVVNVVTRRPASEPGVSAHAWMGGAGERRGEVRLAAARPGRPAWTVSASWLDARGLDLYFPEFDGPATNFGRAPGGDAEQANAVLGSAEWGGTRAAFKFNQRMKRIPTASFHSMFDDTRNRAYDGHDFVELSHTGRPAATAELSGRAYWDRTHYYSYGVYDMGGYRAENFDFGSGDVFGGETRLNWSPGPRNAATFGAEGRYAARARLYNYDLEPFAFYGDLDDRGGLFAAYAQDEVRIGEGVRIAAGARLDRGRRLGPVVSPRADLVWRAHGGLTWKLLAGSAFRAPTVYETSYRDGPPQPSGVELGPERVRTVETSLEQGLGPLTAILSAYRNQVRGLMDEAPFDSTGELDFFNRVRAEARGLEGELQWVGGDGTRARLAAALQSTRDGTTGAELSNSPRWNAHLVLTRAPLESRVTLGAGVRYLSPRITLAGLRTRAALVADARLGVKGAHGAVLGFEVRNLFDARYGDPVSASLAQDQILQNPRSMFATLSLHSEAAR